jgi:glycerophosphoryl diester phosphodiesterase
MLFSANRAAVWGHRGFPRRHPDNTLAGIGAAFGVVTTVETDVRRASDGVLVLSHDPEIDGRVVAETSSGLLSGLDLAGHRMPTLAEILQAFPDRAFDLEVKNIFGQPGYEPDGEMALDTAAVARPQDIVTSFDWPSMDAVRVRMPHVRTGLLFEASMGWELAIDHARDRGHPVLLPHSTLVHRAFLDAAHAAGIRVATWTVDDVADAIRLAEQGVDAIITNDPQRIVSAVDGVIRRPLRSDHVE